MPSDRLLRYSIAGVSFIFFYFYFRFLLGTSLGEIIAPFKDEDFIFPILTFIFTTPVLGVIISTIVFQLVFFGGLWWRIYYTLPFNRAVEDWILAGQDLRQDKVDNLKFLRNKSVYDNGRPKNSSKYLYEYFPYYQIKIRKCITGGDLDYLERKLALFYVHLNILGSIGISFICAFAYFIFIETREIELDLSHFKVTGLILLALYIWFALKVMLDAFHHATEFEHILLEKEYNREQSNEKREKKQAPTTTNSLFNISLKF